MTQTQITNHKTNNLLNDNEFATPTYDEHAALIKKSMMSSLELIKTFIVLKADGETDGIGKSEPKCAGHARRTPTRLAGREEACHLPQAMTMDSNRCAGRGETNLLHHHLLLQARIATTADLIRRGWIRFRR